MATPRFLPSGFDRLKTLENMGRYATMATIPNPSSGSTSAVVQNKLQASRYEFKYIIAPQLLRPIYEFVRCYLQPDQFTPDGLTDGYHVHSLYLDSADLHTCLATLHGDKNRFKLRVRFYDDNPSHPVFFEIKRRESTVILKQRAMVHRCFADDLVNGAPPDMAYLVRQDNKNWKALYDFCR